ncbi:hypothetical protein N7535_002243 [Penicillium sp. DV-2018c]|nr:hypothetical protein N7461_004513 [Penicillium sp. DV-2018c]KAJ5583623.1 hypothetical protein N7535_002243 [Penicillium sp. DV-2018c]
MHVELSIRAQVVTLKAFTEKTWEEIANLTGLSVSCTRRIYKRATDRGFDPDVNTVIYDKYVTDSPRSGRPTKQDTVTKDSELSQVPRDQGKTCDDIAAELRAEGIDISSATVSLVLKLAGESQNSPGSEDWVEVDEEDESEAP